MRSVTWRRRGWCGGRRGVVGMSPRWSAGRVRSWVWVAVASMRAAGWLWVWGPRTVSARGERGLVPGAGDPVGGLVVRLLEAPDRLGRQRAVAPVDRPGREAGAL